MAGPHSRTGHQVDAQKPLGNLTTKHPGSALSGLATGEIGYRQYAALWISPAQLYMHPRRFRVENTITCRFSGGKYAQTGSSCAALQLQIGRHGLMFVTSRPGSNPEPAP